MEMVSGHKTAEVLPETLTSLAVQTESLSALF